MNTLVKDKVSSLKLNTIYKTKKTVKMDTPVRVFNSQTGRINSYESLYVAVADVTQGICSYEMKERMSEKYFIILSDLTYEDILYIHNTNYKLLIALSKTGQTFTKNGTEYKLVYEYSEKRELMTMFLKNLITNTQEVVYSDTLKNLGV